MFVGEAPGRLGPRKLDLVFACKAVGGVMDAVDIERVGAPEVSALLRRSQHRNLLNYWPGEDGKGSYFPAVVAKEKAREFRPPLHVHTLVLLGMRVAAAFNMHLVPYFERRAYRDRLIYVAPHPSGVNRWWNDPANRWQARCFLEGL